MENKQTKKKTQKLRSDVLMSFEMSKAFQMEKNYKRHLLLQYSILLLLFYCILLRVLQLHFTALLQELKDEKCNKVEIIRC